MERVLTGKGNDRMRKWRNVMNVIVQVQRLDCVIMAHAE